MARRIIRRKPSNKGIRYPKGWSTPKKGLYPKGWPANMQAVLYLNQRD